MIYIRAPPPLALVTTGVKYKSRDLSQCVCARARVYVLFLLHFSFAMMQMTARP